MSAQDDALQHIENLNAYYESENWDVYIDPDYVSQVMEQIDGGWEYLAERLELREQLAEAYARGEIQSGGIGQAFFEDRLVDLDGYDLLPAGIDYYHGTFG